MTIADAGTPDSGQSDARSDSGSPDATPIALDADEEGLARFDLLSTSRCRHEGPDLLDCVIPKVTIRDPHTSRRNTPAMTTLSTKMTGNCATQYPIELLVEGDGMRPTRFRVAQQTMDLNRLDRTPVSELSLTDHLRWTKSIIVDQTCHLWLEVAMNRADPL
ncbi:hypothetical protein LZC95_35670 [Pendulispora brunnea]|uniref:Uncharacterized protein n=1 Tax=Pendulispora brunnea TaxID=2905690 RepID=A0ABZ2K3L1_9BACT